MEGRRSATRILYLLPYFISLTFFLVLVLVHVLLQLITTINTYTLQVNVFFSRRPFFSHWPLKFELTSRLPERFINGRRHRL